MTRLVAVVSERVLPTPELNMLTSRSKNVLTTGNCPVYKLFLRRTLGILRDTLVEGGMPEERFVGVLRKVRSWHCPGNRLHFKSYAITYIVAEYRRWP